MGSHTLNELELANAASANNTITRETSWSLLVWDGGVVMVPDSSIWSALCPVIHENEQHPEIQQPARLCALGPPAQKR